MNNNQEPVQTENTMKTKRFLTYEQLDSMIASGVNVTLAESGRALTVWSSANHGAIYSWNSMIQEWQYVGGAFRTEAA